MTPVTHNINDYYFNTWSVQQQLYDNGSTSQHANHAHNYAATNTPGQDAFHYGQAPQNPFTAFSHAGQRAAPTQTRCQEACTFCRDRKIKCNGDKTGCQNCLKSGRICKFEPISEEKKRETREKKLRAKQAREVENAKAAHLKAHGKIFAHQPYKKTVKKVTYASGSTSSSFNAGFSPPPLSAPYFANESYFDAAPSSGQSVDLSPTWSTSAAGSSHRAEPPSPLPPVVVNEAWVPTGPHSTERAGEAWPNMDTAYPYHNAYPAAYQHDLYH